MSDKLMASSAPTLQTTNLELIDRSAAGILVQYMTYDTNLPKTNKNTVYVWEANQDVIPWTGKAPIASKLISKDQSIGSEEIAFDYQPEFGYIVGYSVANDPTAICASLYIPANGADTETKHVTVSSPTFSSDFVKVRYHVLPDYQPSTNQNWCGLWKGPAVDTRGTVQPPLAVVPFNNQDGSVTIKDGVKITIGTTYTVGYLMLPWEAGKTSLASTVTFST